MILIWLRVLELQQDQTAKSKDSSQLQTQRVINQTWKRYSFIFLEMRRAATDTQFVLVVGTSIR